MWWRAGPIGEYAVMDRFAHSLIVVRGESSHIRIFHVPSGSLDAKGRLLVALSPLNSWFNPLGILDTSSGHVVRVPADNLSDHQSGVWTPDGRILFTQVPARASIWKFQPLNK